MMLAAHHLQRHWRKASVTPLGRLCPGRYRDGTTSASGFADRPRANTGSGVRSDETGTDRRRSAIHWIARSLKPSVSPACVRSATFSPRRTRASPEIPELDSRGPHRRDGKPASLLRKTPLDTRPERRAATRRERDGGFAGGDFSQASRPLFRADPLGHQGDDNE